MVVCSSGGGAVAAAMVCSGSRIRRGFRRRCFAIVTS
ncbi:hypothetical protein A2U01_0076177, partial [Trifolium medium]|nr:hypothetical protein [Trifolium medium]